MQGYKLSRLTFQKKEGAMFPDTYSTVYVLYTDKPLCKSSEAEAREILTAEADDADAIAGRKRVSDKLEEWRFDLGSQDPMSPNAQELFAKLYAEETKRGSSDGVRPIGELVKSFARVIIPKKVLSDDKLDEITDQATAEVSALRNSVYAYTPEGLMIFFFEFSPYNNEPLVFSRVKALDLGDAPC